MASTTASPSAPELHDHEWHRVTLVSDQYSGGVDEYRCRACDVTWSL